METLLAGAAKRCVTPSPGLLQAVNADSDRYSYEGIRGDVYVRVLVLSDGTRHAAIVVTDLSIFPLAQVFADQACARYSITPEACLVGGTRTHNAFTINGDTLEELGPGARAYVQFVHEQTLSALEEAFRVMVPAKIGAAMGESRVNANRDLPTPAGTLEAPNRAAAPSAYGLGVVRVADRHDNTIALLANYSMHGTMLAHNWINKSYNYFCGDIVAEITRFVEKAGGDHYPVMWACGGCSEQLPAVTANVDYCTVDDNGCYQYHHEVLPPEATLMLGRQLACEHGLDILRTADAIRDYTDTFSLSAGERFCELASRQPYRRQAPRRMPGPVPAPRPGTKPLRLRYRLAILCGIAFAGVNAEVASTLFARLRAMMPTPVCILFDGSFGCVTALADARNEEEDIYGLSAWGSACYASPLAEQQFVDTFAALLADRSAAE